MALASVSGRPRLCRDLHLRTEVLPHLVRRLAKGASGAQSEVWPVVVEAASAASSAALSGSHSKASGFAGETYFKSLALCNSRADDAPSPTAGSRAWRIFLSAIRTATGIGPSGLARSWIRLGHKPQIHEWEIDAGGDVPKWMEERLQAADRVLCVVSDGISRQGLFRLGAPLGAMGGGPASGPTSWLPVLAEDCEPPVAMAHIKRCSLFGIGEDDARARLEALSWREGPSPGPAFPVAFPGKAKPLEIPIRSIGDHPSRAPVRPSPTFRSPSPATSSAATTRFKRSTRR